MALGSFMYYRGQGVVQDNLRGYMWLRIAEIQNVNTAASLNRTFGAHLSQDEIVAARVLATRCLESKYKDCGE